jgi:predicted permease
MESLFQDLRYGFRALAKSPGFTAVAVASLGLAIGANGAIFNLINHIFLRPLPVESPGELVYLYNEVPDAPYPYDLSYPDYIHYRDGNQVLSGLAGFKPRALNLTAGGRNERIYGELVTGNYFDVLGVEAALGRTFLDEEDRVPGRHPVVVLSHAFWTARFGSNPSIVGETIRLNGQRYTVVGVAPQGFTGLFIFGFSPALWVPVMMADQVSPGSGDEMLHLRDRRWMRVVGRLEDEVSVEEARAAMSTVARQLELQFPDTNKGVGIQIYPEREARPAPGSAGMVSLAMAVFMAIVGMVLLVACANVANLLLARATARSREIAMRLALGATRIRLVQQMLTESVLLALLGGLAGVLFATLGSSLLASIRLPTDIPFAFDLGPDIRVLMFTFVLSLVTGVVFGLAPSLRLTRSELIPALKGEGTGLAGGGSRLRTTLVVAQVSISLIVLVAAALFFRSMQNARDIDPGFDPDNLLLVSVDPTLSGYDGARQERFFRQILERIESVPGVEAASLASPLPLDVWTESVGVEIEGWEARAEDEEIAILYSLVGPNYFETMGTPLVRGGGFTDRDGQGSRPVVVINETMAERYWPDQDPLGKRIKLTGPMAKRSSDRALVEVVGIVSSGKYRTLGESPVPYMFLPIYQRSAGNVVALTARTSTAPGSLSEILRAELRAVDESLPLFDVKTMNEHLGRSLLGAQIAASIVGVFGLLGLVLAAVGLYGVLSYAVSQRTREIGIRVALGAKRLQVIRLVVGQSLFVAAVGVVVGLAAAFALARGASSLLYGVSATDPWIFGTVPLVLVLVALLAAIAPAWRALRVDPIATLRYE